MSVTKKKYNKSYGIAGLTPAGRELLHRCWKANPQGCRSADGECGPPPTYPCSSVCGVSTEEFWQLVGIWKEQEAAKPLPDDFLDDFRLYGHTP